MGLFGCKQRLAGRAAGSRTKRLVYKDQFYDNVGWVNRTKESHGTWGAYAWLLQNEVRFESSTSMVYRSEEGVTNLIGRVMVGTIGDYCPMASVLDIGPVRNTNFPGAGLFTNGIFKGDYTAYYKLVGDFLQEANTHDSDSDNIPDFADGYDLDGVFGTADDLSPNDSFLPWKIYLPLQADPTQAHLRLTYDASAPLGVICSNATIYIPAPGALRVWTLNGALRRNGHPTPSGDFVEPGSSMRRPS